MIKIIHGHHRWRLVGLCGGSTESGYLSGLIGGLLKIEVPSESTRVESLSEKILPLLVVLVREE
jgi:hypothetical protein